MIPRGAYLPQPDHSLASLLTSRELELFGVAATEPGDHTSSAKRAASEYEAWIAAGHHGSMGYLARRAEAKYDPSRVLGGCRSIVIVGMNYFQREAPASESRNPDGGHPLGRVARYAWGRDYHNALGKRLRSAVRELRSRYPDERFRSFVDASPLSERFFAEHAGVGFTARNTLTISSAYGSWFFLGEILTTVPFEPTTAPAGVHGGCPSGCFRCGSVCPTNALFAHHRIDARKCISYLTIEHRGVIAPELRPLMGDWIFGCDLCQEVCPLNVRAVASRHADFCTHRAGGRISLAGLLAIPDEERYRRRFEGSPLRRPGRNAMVRNACIASANTGAVELRPALRLLADDQSPVVREHARWALDQLSSPSN